MCGVEYDALGPFVTRTYLEVDPFMRRGLRWMSNGLREQPIRNEDHCKEDAPDPKKILAYRHDKQTALAESLAS
jgi:hypothetical protein